MKKDIEAGTQLTGEPLYYITNQYNLREILSSGFIGNQSSFDDKYYEDLLAGSQGRVPLFTMPLSQTLIDKVNEHDPETSFSVILQLDHLELPTQSYIELYEDGSETNKRLCIAYAGVISLRHLAAIHFLTDANLSEFAVRQYSNMPSRSEYYRIFPFLNSTTIGPTNILQRLGELPSVKDPTKEDFSTLDRVSGAICLCIFYSKNREQSKQLLRLLDNGRKAKRFEEIPSWFNKGFEARKSEDIANLTDTNEIIFASTVSVLHSYNFNSISQKIRIIEDIRHLVYSHLQNEESKNVLDKSFSKMERVIRLEDDFEPFKTPTGHEALRALFLFLLRPNHRDLLSWDLSETNASYEAMLTALVFSGIIVGRKGLETDYKPAKVDLEISDLLVSTLNLKNEKGGSGKKPTTRTVKQKTAKNSSASLTGNDVNTQTETNDPSLNVRVIREKILKGEQDEAVIKSAIDFSREMGWNNCVSTIIKSPTTEKLSMQSLEQGELRIQLSGFSIITHELDLEQFRINISKIDIDEIFQKPWEMATT